MIQLKILSGKKAGAAWMARRFPVRIGRNAAADLQVAEEGVWDQHLRLEFVPDSGIVLSTQASALAAVNGEQVGEAVLRNGDTIQIGSLKMQFWLSDTRQASLRFREWLTWAGIALISFLQVALVYWLRA